MGCDIHLFVEYRKDHWMKDYWKSFGSEFGLGRHYGIFSSLAGVRNYGDEIKPVCDPRGVPTDISLKTKDSYLFYVTGEPDGDGNEVNPDRAKGWIESGASEYWSEKYVTDPDAHSGSWLTSDEFEKAIRFTFEDGRTFQEKDDYEAVLCAMRSLQHTGHDVRVVFYFDN